MTTGEKRSLPTSESLAETEVLILDIEGTTTSISFVKDTLFPYVRKNLEKYVKDNWGNEDFKAVYEKLVEQSAADVEEKLEGAVLLKKDEEDAEVAQKALVANVFWQMDSDRKAGPLKTLQGYVYRQGYENGNLKGHVFADVAPAFKTWKEAGKQIYIYSSGSVEAQKLLFEHSEQGNLLAFIAGHFDTEVGAKVEAKSYATIASKIDKKVEEITFFTDIVKEANAAKEAGLKVVLLEREGNAPLVEEDRATFTVVKAFQTECEEDDAQNCKKAKIEEEPTEQNCEKAKIEEEPTEPVKDVEMTEVDEKKEEAATKTEAAPAAETKEEAEATEEKPEEAGEAAEKKAEVAEEKMEETTAVAAEVEKMETKEEEKKEESTDAPHTNGVNGTVEKENGHTNGVNHTNGDAPSGDATEVEDKPKEASPVKKAVVSEEKEVAEEAVTAE